MVRWSVIFSINLYAVLQKEPSYLPNVDARTAIEYEGIADWFDPFLWFPVGSGPAPSPRWPVPFHGAAQISN